MSVTLPSHSKRFLRAASTERDDLRSHRERLLARMNALLDEVKQVDGTIAELDGRLEILDRMLDADTTLSSAVEPEPSTVAAPAESGGRAIVAGPAIREAAVRVLLRQPEFIEALHYRRWYDLLVADGYAIRGKNPAAVFLTQLSRSPVIRKSSQPGIYELDRQAPLRLRQRLERLQAELREIDSAPATEAHLRGSRAKRHELNVAISQTERALEEALRVLRREEAGAALGRPAVSGPGGLASRPHQAFSGSRN